MNAREEAKAGIALSVVVPVLDEEEVLPELLKRLESALRWVQGKYEVVLVDDGSRDRTGELIREAVRRDPRIVGVHLSRNFGHQLAITAGLDHARGEAVAIIDGDLQDPPEILQPMYERHRAGHDVVYAVRKDRKEGILLRAAYAGFYRVLAALSTIPIPIDSGDCCVMSRRVVEVIRSSTERHRFIRGLRTFAGFRQCGYEYSRDARAGGRPKYTFLKLLGLAADGIFTFSERPLRLATAVGLVVSIASFAYGAYLVAWRLTGHGELPGFATVSVGMFFLGGVQLLCIGILGEYVGRIHSEVKERPPYVVESVSRARATDG